MNISKITKLKRWIIGFQRFRYRVGQILRITSSARYPQDRALTLYMNVSCVRKKTYIERQLVCNFFAFACILQY